MMALESPEMIVCEGWLNNKDFLIGKYTGSDYDEILYDFMENAINDLQLIKTKLWMDEVEKNIMG